MRRILDVGHEKALFYSFLILFVATGILTLGAISKQIPVDDSYTDKLFWLLILELVAGVLALFKSTFLEKRNQTIRLGFGHGVDVNSLIGATATCSCIDARATAGKNRDKTQLIVDDNGPCISLSPPKNTTFVLVALELDGVPYSGSVSLESRHVEMSEERS